MRAMFKRLSENAKLPTKAHATDVGYDLYACGCFCIRAGRVGKIPTGIAYGGLDRFTEATPSSRTAMFPKIEGRSGLASQGCFPIGGIVDPGYRGELTVVLMNASDRDIRINEGERIAQIVFYTVGKPDIELGELKESDRGTSGFGSTGK